ncbi:hypothetical protein Tco_0276081 [Tanacetum coccineum]
MKLNPRKYSFGVEEGPFLGHLITKQGIKANPSKVKEIFDLRSPKTVKEIQSLNKKLAALSRFLLKRADNALPFLKILKKLHEQKDSSVDSRGRRGLPKNERVYGDITNAYGPNQRRSFGNVPRSFNGKHKCSPTSRKRKKASSYLLRKQDITRGRTRLPEAGKTHISPRVCCKKASKIFPSPPYSDIDR